MFYFFTFYKKNSNFCPVIFIVYFNVLEMLLF